MNEVGDFSARLAARRKELKKDREEVVDPSTIEWADGLVPENERPERSAEDDEIDVLISSIDILEAYTKWCGKSVPDAKGRTEGIKVSCPNPAHPDRDPSAWINTDKQTWFCGGCQEGGDALDIAAWHFGFPVPEYKQGKTFHELRRKIAEDFGYTIKTLPGNVTVIVPPATEDDDGPAQGGDGGTDATVTALPVSDPEEDDDDDFTIFPTLDWKAIVKPDTFLDAWMRATTVDDVPEEYHFWNGVLAIGMALGRDVTLFDSRPVFGNLFVCVLGPSGAGKSKSKSHLDKLLAAALPYDPKNENSKGSKRITTAQSAEALIGAFRKPVFDPNNSKQILYYAPVRGIIDYNELSSLVSRTQRQGNALNPTLMQVYDADNEIGVLSRTYGEEIAKDPFGSAITTTQPRSIRNLVSDADVASGFLNRWVFVTGKEKTRFAIGGTQVDVTPAVLPLQRIHGWAASARVMEWSDEANATFTKFFHDVIHPTQRADESGLLTRMDLLMKKLVLLFSANLHADVVPVEAVHQAMSCWEYLVDCYAIPASHVGNTLQNEIRNEILKHCRKMTQATGRGISMKELNDRIKRKPWPRDLVVRVLDYMVKLEELDVEKTTGVGRPTVRYKWIS